MFAPSKIIKAIGLLVLLVFVVSCKSKQVIASGEVDTSLSAKKIIQGHYQNQLDFTTLSGKVKIDYSDGANSQGVSVSLRMKKDEVIWISAPLGMVKAHITPDKVSFYNKLENEYFDGDFRYLSNILGTDVDFQLVQNLLLGQAVLDLRKDKYSASVAGKTYGLKPKSINELYKILFFLEPKNFKIAKQQISQPLKNRFLQMDYSYQEVTSKVLPNTIAIEAVTDAQTNTIDLEYRNMEFDRQVNFPYKIPKGFKEIILAEYAD